MPTIIALDVSLSMQRNIPGRSEENNLTYHQLAVKGIHQFLDYLNNHSKLEFVSLLIYSTTADVVVEFTRDYESIRQALKKVEFGDKTNLEGMLKVVSGILTTNWGKQNYSQLLSFTDCGLGFGSTSLKYSISNYIAKKDDPEFSWVAALTTSKLNFVCMGVWSDRYFSHATQVYSQFLDVTGLKSNLFLPKNKEEHNEDTKSSSKSSELGRTVMCDLVERVCESSYKQFEATLKCGGYFRLEGHILIWPPPATHVSQDLLGKDVVQSISKNLEICGFLSLFDVGSPASISRHLIISKVDQDKPSKKGSKSGSQPKVDPSQPSNEYDKLDQEIRAFYAKPEDDEDGHKTPQQDGNKESVCVLLHGALKMENMAAFVLLNDNWYGLIYSFADSKKKSNLMLNILPPGNSCIPWMGDFRMFGHSDDVLPGENANFPVKSEKRSYSQNCVVWIKQASLQSDIQKVLRHAKKLPEKTPHFYKELNRIRRAALSIGFVELLESIANIFDKEIAMLPQSASPDCGIQLKHAGLELRKVASKNGSGQIIALPTKYNQL